jgi:hypothetical protein
VIAWMRGILAAPGDAARLRRELQELEAEVRRKQVEIDELSSAVLHWRRLAAALRDVNVDLDTKLNSLQGGS